MSVRNSLYTVAEIRSVEQAVLATLPAGSLMQRAGAAAAAWASELLAETGEDGPVLILAGPGNNGGDALEAARELLLSGKDVAVLLLDPAATRAQDAARALQAARHAGVPFLAHDALARRKWRLAIDGLFGIGLRRSLTAASAALVAQVNGLDCPVLALDVPSGLNADTGQPVGPAEAAVRATHTLTFIADKPGLHTGAGRDYAGSVRVATLDIAPHYYPPARAVRASTCAFASYLRPRSHNSHKGTYGSVQIVGGAPGMTGAAILAARAALYSGAGRVYCVLLGSAIPFDPSHPELMLRDAASWNADTSPIVAGPGLGGGAQAEPLLAKLLQAQAPVVLDADALNLIAAESSLQQQLRQRKQASILTPHPLEAARLLGSSSGAVQADRLAAARELADRFQAVVILKGSGSVIAQSDGYVGINPTGNPGLATAGTGDVLAGICGALLAQGWPAWEAAVGATWMHGAAADQLVQEGTGPVGMTASELMPAVRGVYNQLIRRHAARAG